MLWKKLKVCSSRRVIPKRIEVSNEYECNSQGLFFDFSDLNLKARYKYLVLTKNGKSITKLICKNKFIVSGDITKSPGKYKANVCITDKQITDDDEYNKTDFLFVSDTFEIVVNKNSMNPHDIKHQKMDPNIKFLYDDLLELEKSLVYISRNDLVIMTETDLDEMWDEVFLEKYTDDDYEEKSENDSDENDDDYKDENDEENEP